MMIKESGVNMDNQLYNQIKAVHEQYIKEQNRLEDEISKLRLLLTKSQIVLSKSYIGIS